MLRNWILTHAFITITSIILIFVFKIQLLDLEFDLTKENVFRCEHIIEVRLVRQLRMLGSKVLLILVEFLHYTRRTLKLNFNAEICLVVWLIPSLLLFEDFKLAPILPSAHHVRWVLVTLATVVNVHYIGVIRKLLTFVVAESTATNPKTSLVRLARLQCWVNHP